MRKIISIEFSPFDVDVTIVIKYKLQLHHLPPKNNHVINHNRRTAATVSRSVRCLLCLLPRSFYRSIRFSQMYNFSYRNLPWSYTDVDKKFLINQVDPNRLVRRIKRNNIYKTDLDIIIRDVYLTRK